LLALIREISAYTAPDQLLGLFSTAERAAQARDEYLADVARHDPWREQAYHHNVDPALDLRTVPVEDRRRDRGGDTVYALAEFEEAFGQIYVVFSAVFDDLAQAEAAGAALEQREHSCVYYTQVATVPLDGYRWRIESPDDDLWK